MRQNLLKIIKKTSLFFICALLIVPLTAGVSGRTAEDIDEQIKEAEIKAEQLLEDNRRLESEIHSVQGDVSHLNHLKILVEQSMGGVQERIDVLTEIIDLQKAAIREKEADIEKLEWSIADAEADIKLRESIIKTHETENEENKRKFALMVKNNYMNGSYGYVEMIIQSGDFFDLVMRADVLKKAGERYDDFMQNLLEAIKEQERKIDALEEVKLRLEYDKIDNERQKKELENQLTELRKRMNDLDVEMVEERTKLLGYASGIEELQGQINNMYRQFNATNEEIEEQNRLTEALIREKQNLNRPNYSADGFRWPLDNNFKLITCDFGWDADFGRWHYAIDIGNSGINGANVYAVQSGTAIVVRTGGYGGGYGSYVIIDHGGGVSTLYAHMQHGSVTVSEGQEISKGDVIGLVGNTGYSFGAHLHFEVRENGVAVSPWSYSYE